MSGAVLRALEPTHYVLTQVLAAASSSLSLPLAQHIDASQFRECHVIARVLATKWDDGVHDDIQLEVVADPWDPSSPDTVLIPMGTNSVLSSASLNPNEGTAGPPTDPYALFFKFTECPSMLSIALAATRDASSVQTNNLEITIAVDVVLKN